MSVRQFQPLSHLQNAKKEGGLATKRLCVRMCEERGEDEEEIF